MTNKTKELKEKIIKTDLLLKETPISTDKFRDNMKLLLNLKAELKGRTDARKEMLKEVEKIFLSSDIDSKMYLYCDFITEELNKNNEHRDWKMFAVDLILKDIINELKKLGEKDDKQNKRT
jgi:hypothetical protein